MADIYLFGEDDAKRVKQWAYTDDGVIVARPRIIKGKSKFAFAQVKTGGISALSGSTAGSGTVTIQSSPSTTITATSIEVTAYNLDTHAYAAGEYITIAQEMSTGKWIALPAENPCPCTDNEVTFPQLSQSNTYTLFDIDWTLSTGTLADGQSVELSVDLTWAGPTTPGTDTLRILNGSGVIAPWFEQSDVTATNATSSSTTNYIDEQKVISKGTGVVTNITITVEYTAVTAPCTEVAGVLSLLYNNNFLFNGSIPARRC